MRTGKSWFDRLCRRGFLLTAISFIVGHAAWMTASAGASGGHDGAGRSLWWKAGVGTAVITPVHDMWMAGYAARKRPSRGKIHDLWVKSLVLQDTAGRCAVLITCDLIGFSRSFGREIVNTLMRRYDLPRSAIAVCSSHNHSGPVINENLRHIYPPFDAKQEQLAAQYPRWLLDQVVRSVEKAFATMSPVVLSKGVGIARFAVNRRENSASEIMYNNMLKGPFDHTVPVLAARSPEGKVRAVVFGYACHATTLSDCLWSGDYPGFAQLALERRLEGAQALFFAGCGGDQNPLPRRSVALARQYGEALAGAVMRVLEEPMQELVPVFAAKYDEIDLKYSAPPSPDSLRRITVDQEGYKKRWAENQLAKWKSTGRPGSYRYYPVQTWRLGDLPVVLLGGEVVVDYAIRLKKSWGNAFVAAYANDVMAYIPSERILAEGGYEGCTSMCVYGHPATWAPGLEQKIVEEVEAQLRALDVKGSEGGQ